jgi:vacuolar-type H+-ATPase subunit H
MHSDLELIVSADEEARARVALAEQRHEREVTAARSECDTTIAARRKEATDALEQELQVIREDADARVAELQRQEEQFRATLAAAGERTFDEAVALYLRIVCEVAP